MCSWQETWRSDAPLTFSPLKRVQADLRAPNKTHTRTTSFFFFFSFFSASAMTRINQIILDYNATLISSRARSCIINLTAARSESQTKREKEKTSVSVFYVFSGVFSSSSLSVYQNVRPHPFMNHSSGPNPRLCVAVVPVRLRGSRFTASAGRCHTCL